MTSITSPLALRIDLISDVVCPWCIIGYKQLQRALADFQGRIELELHWHPFELNPQMPEQGQNLREHIQQKYGSTPEQSQAARGRLSALGEELGFEFNYGENTRMVNTFRAHQLLYWAASKGLQNELQMALFAAFFTQQQNLNDTETLLQVVAAVGLPTGEAAALLADARFASTVRDEERRWLEEGIQAVPCFIINQQYMVQGAQDSSAFARMFNKLLASHAA